MKDLARLGQKELDALPFHAGITTGTELRIEFMNRTSCGFHRVRQADMVGQLSDVLFPGAAELEGVWRLWRTQQPVVSVEHHSGLWMRITRIPQGSSRVLHLGEDITAEVELRAMRGLRELARDASLCRRAVINEGVLRGKVAELLALGHGFRDIAAATGAPVVDLAGALGGLVPAGRPGATLDELLDR